MTTLFIEMAIIIKCFIFFKIRGSQNETPYVILKTTKRTKGDTE
jgi:hypothetical protein